MNKNLLTWVVALVLVVVASCPLAAATTAFHISESFVCFSRPAEQAALLLNADHRISVYVESTEQRGVRRAAANLLTDLRQVCQAETSFAATPEEARIVIGTLGHCASLDRLLTRDQRQALKGKYEQFLITAVGQQLVIAGSDRRGAIYGVYELSRQAGVSPWAWWADVPVAQHDSLFIRPGTYTDGEPVVHWRGIFLNDEGPCLMQWVKNTYGTNYGDHRFYEHIYELILRLRGNFLWPAMWDWAFYADDPENSRLADEMGVIIGTSHHEPMARNHQEYARHRSDYGPWNYHTNQARLDDFFRKGIERMKGTEDVVTIGMRGDGDEAMSAEADTRLLERIVEHQRRIIKEVTGRPAKETPQVWALYKEVLEYYEKGMRVPDDVCILLCDDNWGNIRRVPNAQERKHPGGWGLYYHVDYVGAPRNTKWINVTQTQGMWEQLHLAADFGLDRLWVLNVGDLKPMEYQIQFFMDMAWNPQQYDGRSLLREHTRPFCATVVGPEYADEAARLLNMSAKLNSRVTAEMLDANTYSLATGEWERVCGEFARLEADALQLFRHLQPEQRTAYQELILFPIQAMANLYELYRAVAMNRALAAVGDADANLWAERARERFRRDSLLCAEYNTELAGGKWRGMMIQKHIGYTGWNDDFPKDHLPAMANVDSVTAPQASCTLFHDPQHRGYLSIEAEHYAYASAPAGTAWTVYPDMGRTKSAVALTPYTVETGDAALAYRFQLPVTVGEVRVHVIVKSTLDFLARGGHEYDVSLDGGQPKRVNFNARLNEAPENIHSIYYPTIARRVVENTVTLPVTAADTHTLTLHPLTPGIVFEKIVIDYGGYTQQYLFGTESERKTQNAARLPRLFSDGMVFQRGRPIPVWGWADPGEQLEIALGEQRVQTQADSEGRWRASLDALQAGGPYVLTVSSTTNPSDATTVSVQDVWIGDVWLCSGQSNIDTNVERVYPQYPDEIDKNSTPHVRLFRVHNEAALNGPRADVRSDGWRTLSKDNAWDFSAIGYFLGLRMADATGVVQGIIQSSWGGTPIEAWLPKDTMEVIDQRGVMQSELYADAELSHFAAQANNRAAARWNTLLDQRDPGISGNWKAETFDDSAWQEADQAALPTQRWGFCGTYWVRQRINVDAAHAGQAALLEVGTLIDADFTFLNGQQVGHTPYQYPPRRYTVPQGLLHEGENVLTVRFVNRNGSPSFVADKPYRITFADGHQIPLSPRWRVHDGIQMPQQPSIPTGQQNMAMAEWNGMLAPLAPYALSGVVWYQGESSTGKAELYERELTALMHSWRSLFQQPDLPFAIVQLANFMEPSDMPQESGWARLRESQRRAAQRDEHAGLVVALDLGEANDIHPLRKKEVAERCGLVFDRLVFKKKVLWSPEPLSVQRTGDGKITVTFDQPLAEGTVHGFELAGQDGKFHTVEATAQGNEVTLIGDGQRVRYAWKHNPVEADCRAVAPTALPATSFECTVP